MLALAAAPAVLAASGAGHDDHAGDHEPVPTGAALAERCEDYAETLAFTREQLKHRTILGRWNFVRSAHRERERFHDAYCSGDAGHAGGASAVDH
jgi:hypothetical protein